jgi:alkanesulfonate monooxygenase SsuD/methylene tetrahydromethanopterin reductase-like flavin-dependent oxidoreductase (luciferase family)
MGEYDELFREKLDLMLRLREEDRVTWSGRYRPPLHDAEIAPRAVQDPLPVWVGVGGSPGSAERAGRLGLPMMLGYIGGTLAHARRAVDIYREAGEKAGHPEKLRVGISTHLYAASSEHDAADVFEPYHRYLHPNTNNGRGARPGPGHLDELPPVDGGRVRSTPTYAHIGHARRRRGAVTGTAPSRRLMATKKGGPLSQDPSSAPNAAHATFLSTSGVSARSSQAAEHTGLAGGSVCCHGVVTGGTAT